ncbi:histone acetyltransferase [Candidatus Nitrosotenuis sp. DW1]|nr:histone acetyltransferase [Candidatus Nitrosotenuis sp. DW1]
MVLADIPGVIELQKAAFPYMAAEGVIWKPEHLESHISVFPEGQFCAEYQDTIIGSCSSLIIIMTPEYKDHTWKEACGDSFFKNHDPKGDTLYAADVSTHPDYRRLGVASRLYEARKSLAVEKNLRRIIGGGRLFNYCEHAKTITPYDYVMRVKKGEIQEPVLMFQLSNGFDFIKILPNYLKDARSLNNATFIEWKNPQYRRDS